MKTTKRISWGILLAIVVSATQFNAQSQSFLSGEVAYYPFNGNANDMSGNGNNGIVENANLATDRFGNANACYQFTNSWIFVPYSASLYPTNQTISIWFKQTGVYHDTSLMRAGNVQDDNNRGFGINTWNANGDFGVSDFGPSGYASQTGTPVSE